MGELIGDRVSRRAWLRSSGVVAAGASLAVAGQSAAHATPAPAGRRSRPATVHGVHGEKVEVLYDDGTRARVAAVGFPAGWIHRAGDRVMVAGISPHDIADSATPLIHHLTGSLREVRSSAVLLSEHTLLIRGNARDVIAAVSGAQGVRYDAFCVSNVNEAHPTCLYLRPIAA